jgi:hypothetical protein
MDKNICGVNRAIMEANSLRTTIPLSEVESELYLGLSGIEEVGEIVNMAGLPKGIN